MCWIFAYKWPKAALPILQHWLERLEYRWYDSAWVCVLDQKSNFHIIKSVWKVSELESNIITTSKSKNINQTQFTSWIAHTRWATHGIASIQNTHPHTDMKHEFFVVHNGIIENHAKLKKQLKDKWYQFYSETDTEVVPALLAEYWTWDLLETVEAVLPLLHGAYALAIMTTHNPNEIVAVKRWSPLVLWIAPDEFFFSSDIQALAWYATNTVTLKDGELVHVKDSDYIIKYEWKIIQKTMEKLDIQAMSESMWAYDSFMRKEIDEQPAIIRRAFLGRINFDTKEIHSDATEFLKDKKIENVVFIWCWTSYNSWNLWAKRIQDLAGIESTAKIASEYIYEKHLIKPTTLYVFLSQSGETADSIEVLKDIKAKWGLTFGIVNVVWSTIANMTDCGFFLRAGYEIWVASTKAFTAQLTCILMLALFLWKRGDLPHSEFTQIIQAIKSIPTLMENLLAQEDAIADISKKLADYKSMFFLWRKYQSVIADEGSLKLKELSYIHSESYPAGELKHGPLALIEESFPTVLLAPSDMLFDQNMSSMAEIQARKWKVLVISDKEAPWCDRHLSIPSAHPIVMPYLTTLIVQLMSYHIAKHLGRDIDKPRNLAKSVTVK